MEEKRCILCNRTYEYEKYQLFGRGCLSNLYNLLNISNPPRGTKNKEISSKYGVIKPYTVIIKFEMKNYLITEVKR